MQHILKLPEHLLPRKPMGNTKQPHKRTQLNPKSQSIPFNPHEASKKYPSKKNDQYGMPPEMMHYPPYQYQAYPPAYGYLPYYQAGMHPNFHPHQYSPYGQPRPVHPRNPFPVPMMQIPPPQSQEEVKQPFYGNVTKATPTLGFTHQHQNIPQPNSAGLPTQSSKRARIGSLHESQRGRL